MLRCGISNNRSCRRDGEENAAGEDGAGKSLDYNSDEYGKVDDGELGILGRRRTGIAEWTSAASHGSNKTIFKNSLSLSDDLDRIVVDGSDYDAVLAVFRRHGYDKWPDGRDLSEVIRKTK